MVEGRRRLLEAAKSLLIFLLALSAVFLAMRAFLPYEERGGDGVVDLLTLVTADPLSGAGVARPVRMAVRNSAGRYGAQYDDAAVDPLFDALGDLLGEALASAGAAVAVDRVAWEEALAGQGVYYDFPGIVDLPLLSAWLGEGESGLEGRADCLLLAAGGGEDKATLYYMDADDGGCYACGTLVEFRQRLEEYTPNRAVFAFEEPERYGGLDPDTLILPTVPAPPVFESAAGVSLQEEGALEGLLDALSFSPQPNAVYPAADGWNVREAEDSLRLTRAGNIYYHGGEDSDRYPVTRGAARAELVEAAGELVRLVMAPYCGEARIYLDEVARSGNGWTLTYRYALSGAEVQLGQEGWCARFTIENGQIREYVLKLRRYTRTETAAALLPEYQAMHAMEALEAQGKQLLLRYYDGGAGAVSPSWIAR